MPNSHEWVDGGGPTDLSTLWLRAFLEVARRGSFTVAARDLALTQSAVSRQIASLEAALGGAPLFDRLPRGVRLTAHGRELLPHAEAVTARLADLRRGLAELDGVSRGLLRFGAFATADAALVPRAIAAFRARHPGVTLTREEGRTRPLLARLAEGELDLAVVSTTGGPLPEDGYELRHLLDETLYVALPAAHPLAGEASLPLARLADEDWISGSPEPAGTLLDAAARDGFRPRVAHVVGEWTAKQGYVAAGLGVTLVPALAAHGIRRDVALVPVRDEGAPARAVYAATARDQVTGAERGAVPGRPAGVRAAARGLRAAAAAPCGGGGRRPSRPAGAAPTAGAGRRRGRGPRPGRASPCRQGPCPSPGPRPRSGRRTPRSRRAPPRRARRAPRPRAGAPGGRRAPAPSGARPRPSP
ncbi:LysR substrate-binding domain-containing protein [Streptomyces sp. PmtG]